MTKAASHLISISQQLSATLPPAISSFLPSDKATHQTEQIWAPILAWITLRSLPHSEQADLFDKLQLRSALSEIFSAIGMEGENTWRAAARVRILLSQTDNSAATARSEQLWSDPDVRWLTGVNESSGATYFNKEGFEELLGWLQLPTLVKAAQQSPIDIGSLKKLDTTIQDLCDSAQKAGYNLDLYLNPESHKQNELKPISDRRTAVPKKLEAKTISKSKPVAKATPASKAEPAPKTKSAPKAKPIPKEKKPKTPTR